MRLSIPLSGIALVAPLIFSDTGSQSAVPSQASVTYVDPAPFPTQTSLISPRHINWVQQSSSSQSSDHNSQAGPTKNMLAPFTTDGCSMWIDGPLNQPWLWRHCCVSHDRIYWIGGTATERRKSDQDLQKCITDVAGKFMGDSMYMGVMPGGSPYWVTPYRWGYGWSYFESGKLRGYKSLNEEELAQANALIPDAEKTIAQDASDHPANFRF
jgi:hypothetical protein